MNLEMNKELFYDLVHANIHRRGITTLMEWLEATDFFTAPASTKYHGSFEGGLLAHSLEVYYHFLKLAPVYNYPQENKISIESATICSLFHDICKVNTYEISTRNIKDESGKWVQVPYYSFVNNPASFGSHGFRSVMLIREHMYLTVEEAYAIYYHMGKFDASPNDNPADFYSKSKLGWILHIADEAATHISKA